MTITEGIDITAAKQIARGKNQKAWLDALLSDEGLLESRWVQRTGGYSNYGRIQHLIFNLRWEGYEVTQREVVVGPRGGKSKCHHLTGYSEEQHTVHKLQRVLGQLTRSRLTALERAYYQGGQTMEAQNALEAGRSHCGRAAQILYDLGPVAVESAYALAPQWGGSLDDLATAIRALLV